MGRVEGPKRKARNNFSIHWRLRRRDHHCPRRLEWHSVENSFAAQKIWLGLCGEYETQCTIDFQANQLSRAYEVSMPRERDITEGYFDQPTFSLGERLTVCVSCVLPHGPVHETESVFRAGKCASTEHGSTSACTLWWAGFVKRF
jgi:hypothetical protein